MSQMPDFLPNNTILPIFYENNHFDIHLISVKPVIVAQNYLNLSLINFFGNFKAAIS